MKFTKVVILAGALAVSAVPQIAHSQNAATSETLIAEKSKADGLQTNIGKYCRVYLSGDRSKDLFEGNLKSASISWLVLENDTTREVDGKSVAVKFQTYIPMKEVGLMYFSPPPITID